MTRILCIGKVWPEPASSAAGSRMMTLLNSFRKNNHDVVFCSVSNPTEFSYTASDLPFESFQIALNDASFDGFVKKQAPDVVLFDRFTTEEQFGWRVAAQCPGALRVLDTEDLHGLREARRIALQEKRKFTNAHLLNDVFKREVASIYRSDLSLIISEFEMDLLTGHLKIDEQQLFYLPFYSEPVNQERKSELPAFKDRSDFISIGNFLHAPNADAVNYMRTEIWPRIRKLLPAAELHVYGAYAAGMHLQLNDPKNGFLVKGRAIGPDDEMSGHRVCLAPLRFGAGLKGKLLQAMQNGTPAVTTSIGSEGMHGNLPFNGCVVDDPDKFAEAAVKLYSDESFWKEKQLNGYQIINDRFHNEHHQSLIERINWLKQNLDSHREKNFTGAMLMHHFALSTRYMALWIEEKNKKTRNSQNK